MPKYIYKCHKCNNSYEVQHAFGEEYVVCSQINPDCEQQSSIERVPQIINYLPNTSEKASEPHKVGDIVNDFIDDTKKEIKEYKKELKNWELKK